jgi:hypothetical protein
LAEKKKLGKTATNAVEMLPPMAILGRKGGYNQKRHVPVGQHTQQKMNWTGLNDQLRIRSQMLMGYK